MSAFSSQEIKQKYGTFAKHYDKSEWLAEVFVRKYRRSLLQDCYGKVLEIGAGTGKNFQYYLSSDIIAVDLSLEMFKIARHKTRANSLSRNIEFCVANVEELPFPDNTFAYVVDSFGLCTFSSPLVAIKEMARVCKPKGKILLLEHGKSNFEIIASLQDRTAEWHAQRLGCYWNRDILSLIKEAGLKIETIDKKMFGILDIITARKLPNKHK